MNAPTRAEIQEVDCLDELERLYARTQSNMDFVDDGTWCDENLSLLCKYNDALTTINERAAELRDLMEISQ